MYVVLTVQQNTLKLHGGVSYACLRTVGCLHRVGVATSRQLGGCLDIVIRLAGVGPCVDPFRYQLPL